MVVLVEEEEEEEEGKVVCVWASEYSGEERVNPRVGQNEPVRAISYWYSLLSLILYPGILTASVTFSTIF